LLQHFSQKIKSASLNQWIETAGVVGLFVFVFGILLRKSIAHAGIITMGVTFGFSLKDRWREVMRDRLVQLSAAFFVFLVIRAFLATLEFPEHKVMIVVGALKLFGAGFLLAYVVAFWLDRSRGAWDEMIIVLMVGFLVQILRQTDWAHFSEMVSLIAAGNQRATFGFSTNRFGLFSALIFLACMLLHRQIWGPRDKVFWHKTRLVFWSLMCSLSLWGLVFSQSRSAWLAFALVMPATAIYKLRHARITKLKILLLIGCIVLISAVVFNIPKILRIRLSSGIDSESVSARLSLYQIAWQNWKKYPLVGRGPGTSWIMIQQAGEEYNALKLFDHLHNVVFDIGAQTGIVGVISYVLSFYLILMQTFTSRGERNSGQEYIHFASGGIAMILLTGIPNQPLSSPHGVYLIGLLGGICYSFKFISTHSIQTNPSHDESE
jgi:O-antigen ligase